MRIVIDLQGAQSSGSHNRGIGRYSLSLAKAIVRNRDSHEVIVALNGVFPQSIDRIRDAFSGLLSQDNIRVWSGPTLNPRNSQQNGGINKVAELVREAFLASLSPDIIHVSSLFEGLSDDAVTSIGRFTCSIPTAVTLYDLIPLIHRQRYLADPVVERWYEEKIGHVRRAHLWLAISESSRQEGIRHLGLPEEWSVNVSTAADAQFLVSDVPDSDIGVVLKRHGITRPFVMYTGGIDHRKNIEGLIRAYARIPPNIRLKHQLAIVCSVQKDSRDKLELLAGQCGLMTDDLVLTGFVSDSELVSLYRRCRVFVFPSWHEGFGLPALEAMSCGAPTIGAMSSSLPEVIGWKEALFDPMDDEAISEKIARVLNDEAFRSDLIKHGRTHAKTFSWDECARRAISSFERLHEYLPVKSADRPPVQSNRRPRLAFVSPLPPARSGIADYSAELLPALVQYYEIDVIVAQGEQSDPWIRANCVTRSVKWFMDNGRDFDRVLYQFGNSDSHEHMFHMLDLIPGVVVLHDFFLSGIVAYMGWHGQDRNLWTRELYRSHGYCAVKERFHVADAQHLIYKYPCNLSVLRKALGIVVHSNYSRRLADEWYGSGTSSAWHLIPLLRTAAVIQDRRKAQEYLGFPVGAVVVCSFGGLSRTKLNDRLLDCWLEAGLANNEKYFLVFVGANDTGEYGALLEEKIRLSGFAQRILITGWVDVTQFRKYLVAADIAVQLRTLSRGETSAAVLDCMNHGIPTVINANGALDELSQDIVLKLPEDFSNAVLIDALRKLVTSKNARDRLGERGREEIRMRHAPNECARLYFESIEQSYETQANGKAELVRRVAGSFDTFPEPTYWAGLAKSIAASIAESCRKAQILVDVSALINSGVEPEILRFMRGVVLAFLANSPEGFRVEPVYATADTNGYLYARRFTLRLLGCPEDVLDDQSLDVFQGDVFFGLSPQRRALPWQEEFFSQLKRIGVKVNFAIYDLLPVLLPQYSTDESRQAYMDWLHVVEKGDKAICISHSVADELLDWLTTFGQYRGRPFEIAKLAPTLAPVCQALSGGIQSETRIPEGPFACATFLMVGAIELRRGHALTLAAFERLWQEKINARLIIVGLQGDRVESLMQELRYHREAGRRLVWVECVGDPQLRELYRSSACLIVSSEAEGYCVPILEAAEEGMPIIARDTPIFRELAGGNARYFSGTSPDSLAATLKDWLKAAACAPMSQSNSIVRSSWNERMRQLIDYVLHESFDQKWMQSDGRRFWGSDLRLQTQVGYRAGRDIVSGRTGGYLIHGPYINVEPGTYRVLVNGKLGENGASGAIVDIATDDGNQILGRTEIHEPVLSSKLALLEFSLFEAASDLEIRIWVSKESDLTVSSVDMQPIIHDSPTNSLPL